MRLLMSYPVDPMGKIERQLPPKSRADLPRHASYLQQLRQRQEPLVRSFEVLLQQCNYTTRLREARFNTSYISGATTNSSLLGIKVADTAPSEYLFGYPFNNYTDTEDLSYKLGPAGN